ncbi:hypothetical protein F4X33_18390, partial [Candidatus Poribacteria bacterium]|nr:hypothetical protein [Candidatus Poribacteria bacterium]
MIDLLQQSNTYQSLVETLTAQFSGARCAQTPLNQQTDYPKPWLRGLHGASTAYLLSALAADFANKSFLIVVPTQHEAEKIIQDLPAYHFGESHLFPQWQNFLYDGISPTKNVVAERLICLYQLLKGDRTFIVTSIQALMHKILPQSVVESAFLTLRIGDEIAPDKAVEQLLHNGYQRVDLVEVMGEIACRGEILEVSPLTAAARIRIEFFGD